jgi:aminotransferase
MFLSLQAFLNPGDEVLVPNPGYGQFYSCVKLKGPAKRNAVDLFVRPGRWGRCPQILEKGGVAVVPGTSFGAGGEGYLRISYATSSQNCREGMERIAHAMALLGR